ncbi:MAG: aminotransferase class I/II-fold pyridoxal phosphate-dependent enzyme [Pseudomonadota bacterium]|nr:aminotransferase class I/II-fold pyridoxal phosphate-dependent enzyme [Pseudomonadota bacterium]MED5390168.1 aminotransferase class I/II-fold pyridoxal phosphate-dependent enzyme [Pseudomonadota bacterium]|tara:strand:+ start:569 stop:1825 length:1257 start_codon:yes stop_codon:yes gene_type:complete
MSSNQFPTPSVPQHLILAQLQQLRDNDPSWYGSKMFIGGSYFGGEDVLKLSNNASRLYQNYNALYAGKMFPSLVAIEKEVVSWCLDLLGASSDGGGSLTSGGTESLLLAVMAARDWARAKKPTPDKPEILIPEAAHPGFDKAAHLMDLKPVRLSQSPQYRADTTQLENAVTPNTIMIIGSAPSYPYGITDPICEIAEIAQRHQLWCHVDACHGGFILPFARQLGRTSPDFDFSVAGVTSISVDIHKLGYANKGVSALLLANSDLQQYQRYTFTNWPAGLYTTMGISGSRSAGGLSSAWAVIKHLGTTGYQEIVSEILQARDQLIDGIKRINGLHVVGNPDSYLVAIGSDKFDVLEIDNIMSDKGWINNQLHKPPAMHLFLDRANAMNIEHYLNELVDTITAYHAGERAVERDPTEYAR